MNASARTLSARAPFAPTLLSLFTTALLLGFTGCGGASSEAKSAGHDGPSPSSSGDSGSTGEGESAASEVPTGADCSDGTCFECGDGICPRGAYCDQNAEGGAACAWLPECSGTAACDCITGVLKGCSCEDTSGGSLVSCQ